MNSYQIALTVHITCVAFSGSFFTLRGLWMLTDSPLLRKTLVRVLPHVVDTLLLISAVTLAIILKQYPFTHDWLTVKVMLLLAYILLGMGALRFGRTRKQRGICYILALVTFAYMVSVALTRHPAGLFAVL